MSRALMGTISSYTVRLFSFSVVPVSTISTMMWLSPRIGASSMEPLRWIVSISRHFPA